METETVEKDGEAPDEDEDMWKDFCVIDEDMARGWLCAYGELAGLPHHEGGGNRADHSE